MFNEDAEEFFRDTDSAIKRKVITSLEGLYRAYNLGKRHAKTFDMASRKEISKFECPIRGTLVELWLRKTEDGRWYGLIHYALSAVQGLIEGNPFIKEDAAIANIVDRFIDEMSEWDFHTYDDNTVKAFLNLMGKEPVIEDKPSEGFNLITLLMIM